MFGDFAMMRVYRHRRQVGFIPWLGGLAPKMELPASLWLAFLNLTATLSFLSRIL
jgi:hypothetical protein